MKRLPTLFLLALLLVCALLVLDKCSRTRKPTTAAEAVLYALWQTIRYPGDQTDHHDR